MAKQEGGGTISAVASLEISGSELVLGLVGAVGTDLDLLTERLEEYLSQYGYETKPNTCPVRLSELIRKVGGETLRRMGINLVESPEAERLESYMDGGNALRMKSGRNDFLALQAINEIARSRGASPKPSPRTAHILRSLKHPEEVAALRKVYGPGFFLIAAYMPESDRIETLKGREKDREGIDEDRAKALVHRDEREEARHGQQTGEAFRLADVFVDLSASDWETQLRRFLDLVFGNPHLTPMKAEHAMFLAYAASLRSGDLSRQVGAVVATEDGEVLATGANDVPSPGGGLYWADGPDVRDHVRRFDANETLRDQMILKIMRANLARKQGACVSVPGPTDEELVQEGRQVLGQTGLLQITEFGRSVHAEMEALLACARAGISPRKAILFTTTFPCHNCARHIIAAGIDKVIYIEPYPKSKAFELHPDALSLAGAVPEEEEQADLEPDEDEQPVHEPDRRVRFEPFVGVGPRRYLELFSMTRPTGERLVRKRNGRKVRWSRSGAQLRAPMAPTSYLDREEIVSSILRDMADDAG